MGNGSAERFNQTLLKMLGTLSSEQKADWKTYIAPLVQAYNSTRHDSTGFSLHYLMFGWHPRIPVDAYLGTFFQRDDQASDHKTYAARLRERLEYAYHSAAAEASRQSTKSEAAYNQRVKDSRLDVGDTVLVRNVGLQGKHKLADRWDSNPYVVLEMPNTDIPVYKVRRPDKVGPVQCLHRNLLLPFNSVPLETTGEIRKDPPMYLKRESTHTVIWVWIRVVWVWCSPVCYVAGYRYLVIYREANRHVAR